ncbi:MAG TPA: SDR family oxidoreductase [Actinomycetota bacterium]|nr:SDR family oxidoreductase [Actinomycetota bacterium]
MAAQDLFSLRGKTAVVTGGSRGIGLMIARGFVQSGVKVYISSRKAQVCDEVAGQLSQEGECLSVPADLATEEGVSHLASEMQSREPAVHILVNNAGAAWGAPFEEYPMSGFDRVWNLNVKAVFRLTQLLLPQLRAAATPDDPARVVNIGSIDGIRVPVMENYAYSASKAAVHMLTRHMAKALVADHITVNAIAPGLFPSQMTKFLFSDESLTDSVVSSIPLGRHGRPDDMAGAAIYLSSRAGAFVTGSILVVDGGSATLQ